MVEWSTRSLQTCCWTRSAWVDTGKAKSVVESWRAYLDEHRSEITAIQLLAEARERRVSFGDIKELADRISRPP